MTNRRSVASGSWSFSHPGSCEGGRCLAGTSVVVARQNLLGVAAYAPRVRPFGQDWQGNQYALDNARREHNEPLGLMFEISSMDVFELPFSFVDFHEELLPADKDVPLSGSRYLEWRRFSDDVRPLSFSECVGHKVPFFLGGDDNVANLARTNIQVHWSITAQLSVQTRDLPDGTGVPAVRID
jgi:hypothetical protein